MAQRTGKTVIGKFTRSGRSVRGSVRCHNARGRQRAYPTCGRMSRVLTFGKRSSPSCIVVMLHGLNDSAECCAEGVAQMWAEGMSDALIVAPQSPDRSIWSTPGDAQPGYDWLRQRGIHNTNDHEANVRELQRVARSRVLHLESWLRSLLKKHKLGPDRLVLTGFSQGSILAALCAVRLGARGAVVCGGVTGQPVYSAPEGGYVGGGWMRWEELLSKIQKASTKTRFCAINGTVDCFVPKRHLEAMLQPFECFWHWDEGVGHDFPKRWYKIALKWMAKTLGDSNSG